MHCVLMIFRAFPSSYGFCWLEDKCQWPTQELVLSEPGLGRLSEFLPQRGPPGFRCTKSRT